MHSIRSRLDLGTYVLLVLGSLGLSIAPAAAGDFTGFYGGVNAGGALDHATERRAVGPNGTAIPASGSSSDVTALPPSAAGAASDLRKRDATGPHRSPR